MKLLILHLMVFSLELLSLDRWWGPSIIVSTTTFLAPHLQALRYLKLPQVSCKPLKILQEAWASLGDHECRKIFCPVAFPHFKGLICGWQSCVCDAWIGDYLLAVASIEAAMATVVRGATWPMEGPPDCVASPPGLPPCSDFPKVA